MPHAPFQTRSGLTIAIPVYNEESILVGNTRRLLQFLDDLGCEYQVLIGSNGSTDLTRQLGERLAAEHPCIEFFHLGQRGVGLAFREFAERARHRVLVSLDMDLSVDLRFVADALLLIGRHDIVVGSKKLAADQRRSAFRKAGSDIFLRCVRLLMKLPYDDYSIGGKAYDVRFLQEHVDAIDAGSSYVLDLCYAASREGRPIACVPVRCEDRRASRFNLAAEARYKFGRLFSLWLSTRCRLNFAGRRLRVPANT